jgi:peptidyl-dipeptidase A
MGILTLLISQSLYLGLTDIITNSRDYDELLEAWKGWRDVSGAKMKDKYAEFVQLMNKAIKAGGIICCL